MALTYYGAYLEGLAMTPNSKYRNDIQALVNSQWDNTTVQYDVGEETEIGSFEFNPIAVYINHVVEETSTGRKNGDDFRKLIFKDIIQENGSSDRNTRGLLYQFDDNFWITTFTDNYNSVSEAVVVRRCNNLAKYVDENTGDIISIPCILDYTPTSPSPKYMEDIVTPDNHVVMIVQGNKETIKWKQNKRFIFNGRPFKITGYNNYMQNSYIDQDTTILYIDLYLDEIQPSDDIENNVANRYEHTFSIMIQDGEFEVVQGGSGRLQAIVMRDNEQLSIPLQWWAVPSESATIDENGNYQISADVELGSKIEFHVATSQYKTVQDEAICTVVETVAEKKEIVITPVFTQVRQGNVQIFEPMLMINGIKQNVDITVTAAGVKQGYYTLSKSDNTYALTCIKPTSDVLVLTIEAEDLTLQKEVKLVSAF